MTAGDIKARFRDIVKTEAELRAILGSPDDLVLEKVIDFIDEPERVFIAAAPFMSSRRLPETAASTCRRRAIPPASSRFSTSTPSPFPIASATRGSTR